MDLQELAAAIKEYPSEFHPYSDISDAFLAFPAQNVEVYENGFGKVAQVVIVLYTPTHAPFSENQIGDLSAILTDQDKILAMNLLLSGTDAYFKELSKMGEIKETV